MSNGTFVAALAIGAALLAAWTYARFPRLTPDRLVRTMAHVVVASVVLSAAPAATGTLGAFAGIFLLVLPALVYALLSAIWMLEHMRAALGLQR